MTDRHGRLPPGWDEQRMRRVIAHYEHQSDDEALAEDEAVLRDSTQTLMEIPNELVPAVRKLLAQHGT